MRGFKGGRGGVGRVGGGGGVKPPFDETPGLHWTESPIPDKITDGATARPRFGCRWNEDVFL